MGTRAKNAIYRCLMGWTLIGLGLWGWMGVRPTQAAYNRFRIEPLSGFVAPAMVESFLPPALSPPP